MSTRAHRQPRVSALSGRHPAVPLTTEALPAKLEMPGMPPLPEIPAVQKLTVTVSRALADEARDAFWACRGDYRTFSAFIEEAIRRHVEATKANRGLEALPERPGRSLPAGRPVG